MLQPWPGPSSPTMSLGKKVESQASGAERQNLWFQGKVCKIAAADLVQRNKWWQARGEGGKKSQTLSMPLIFPFRVTKPDLLFRAPQAYK